MATVVEVLSWFCFLVGGFMCITGAVGLLRLPDFFSRIHASSITDTLAAPLLLTGVMLQVDPSLDTVKLLMVLIFVFVTNPTATHAMVKAALNDGQVPLVGKEGAEAREEKPSNN
ncbi:MAG: monovalent cation/H(+) antiporter subunit G [Planctomycetota bacterium]|jgi:multicomponent Na+:H+ antiporter subunit G